MLSNRNLNRIAIFAVLISMSAVAIGSDLTAVLANARKAIGTEAFQRLDFMLEAKGKANALGVDGDYTLLFSNQGEFLERFSSVLASSSGFDGKTAWSTDWSGATRILELEDLEVQRTVVAIITGHWLADKSPLEFQSAEDSDNHIVLKARFRDGELAATILIDKASHLVTEFSRKSSAGDDVWKLSEYIDAFGIKVPGKIINSQGGQTNTFSLTAIDRAPIFVRNPFEMIDGPIPQTQYDSNAAATVESRRAISGHLLIKPKINGKDIGWFILDSGAGALCIDSGIADREGLNKVGAIPVVGVGGVVLSSMRTANSIQVGQVSWTNPIFVEIDLAQIGQMLSVELAGIVGYDLMARGIVEMDTQQNFVAVHDPKSYTLSSGQWTTLHLDGKHPVVEARFEGDRKGLFRLDTGANNTLTFHTAWVERYDLLKDRQTVATALGGVGGMTPARQGRIEWFELGGERFENPSVTFSQSKVGPLSDAYTIGNIGQGFLRPFKLVFDYPNRRMAFVKR
ncbi:MAG: aspartyl protease family protein [Fimbriimonadales bacterium]|nr:aspartyl protease family protein [Fimbriimonadales bacterium]